MQTTMQQRCNARVQAFRASPKATIKAFAPTNFAGLRRANVLDMDVNMAGSLTQVSAHQNSYFGAVATGIQHP